MFLEHKIVPVVSGSLFLNVLKAHFDLKDVQFDLESVKLTRRVNFFRSQFALRSVRFDKKLIYIQNEFLSKFNFENTKNWFIRLFLNSKFHLFNFNYLLLFAIFRRNVKALNVNGILYPL